MHIVGFALLSVMIASGYGKHPWDAPYVNTLVMMTRTRFTITAATWSKTAFAVTMLRIATGWVKWATWFVLISLNIICGLNALIGWVGCSPVRKSWDQSVPGTCLPFRFITNLGYVAGAYSSFGDFILALLPWPIIWTLQMQTREKIGVGIAMSMGMLAGVMAAAKTASISKLDRNDSFDAAHLSMFDSAEISVTIIAASLPTMRVLFRDLGGEVRRYYYGEATAGRSLTGAEGVGGSVVIAGGLAGGRENLKDDGSEREILGEGRAGIVREGEVEVEYRRVSGGGEIYELRSKS